MLRSLLLATTRMYAPADAAGGAADPADDADLSLDDAPADDNAPDDGGDAGDESSDDNQDDPPAAAATDGPPDPGTKGRAGDTIRSLRARAQENDRRAREAERRAEEAERRLTRETAPAQPRRETPAEYEARLALMTPEQRMETRTNDALRRLEEANAITAFQTMDAVDKSNFDNMIQSSRLHKRFAQDVENELARIRSQGGNVPRQALLYWAVGKALVEKEQRTGDATKNRAQRRVDAATARAVNGRGDVGSARRGDSRSLEQRLENVPL